MAIGTPVDLGHNSRSGSFNSVTLTIGATGAAVGTKVVVIAANANAPSLTVTFTDSKGNTWNTDVTQSPSTPSIAIGSSDITNALVTNDTITSTWSATANNDYLIAAMSITGLATGLGTGTPGTGTGSVAHWTSAAMTTTNANEIIIGASCRAASTTMSSADSGYTKLHDFNDGTRTVGDVYQIVSATGTYTPGGTWSSAGTQHACGVTYQIAAGGAALLYGLDTIRSDLQAVARLAQP